MRSEKSFLGFFLFLNLKTVRTILRSKRKTRESPRKTREIPRLQKKTRPLSFPCKPPHLVSIRGYEGASARRRKPTPPPNTQSSTPGAHASHPSRNIGGCNRWSRRRGPHVGLVRTVVCHFFFIFFRFCVFSISFRTSSVQKCSVCFVSFWFVFVFGFMPSRCYLWNELFLLARRAYITDRLPRRI